MLAVVDRMLWATLGVLIGRYVNLMTGSHGDVRMNAPMWAHIYVPKQCSYSVGIVMVSLSKEFIVPRCTHAKHIASCTSIVIRA